MGKRKVLVEVLKDESLLEDVIQLGNQNKKYLGLFPVKAYEASLENGEIIVAKKELQVVGYLLFFRSKRKRQLKITHLCTHDSARGEGIARLLVDELKKIAPKYFIEIFLKCRNDFPAHGFWPKIGFIAINESQGKSKEGKLLTSWRYDLGRHNLFSEHFQDLYANNITVSLDMNILVYMSRDELPEFKNQPILEDVEFCYVQEIKNEIVRGKSELERKRMRTFISGFHELKGEFAEVEQVQADLKNDFPDYIREINDLFDLKLLAASIVSGSDFFVTKDKKLHQLSEKVHRKYGIKVVKPIQLILELDQHNNDHLYEPLHLGDQKLKIVKASSNHFTEIIKNFHDHSTDGKRVKFDQKVSQLLLPGKDENCFVLKGGQSIKAFWVERTSDNRIEIEELRIKSDRLRNTILSGLLNFFCEKAALENSSSLLIRQKVNKPWPVEPFISLGFIKRGNEWLKYFQYGIQNIEMISVPSEISGIDLNDTELERALWPVKLSNINFDCFIVPIQQKWAMHLFDRQASLSTLFGAEPQLIFNFENVYYRSATPKVLPLEKSARILWYVSEGKDKGETFGKSIRAASYLDEVHIGPAKDLFKKFKRLGVYKIRDIKNIGGSQLEKTIMAFKFSQTELFNQPVSYEAINEIALIHGKKKSTFPTVLKIPSDLYMSIYQKGTQRK